MNCVTKLSDIAGHTEINLGQPRDIWVEMAKTQRKKRRSNASLSPWHFAAIVLAIFFGYALYQPKETPSSDQKQRETPSYIEPDVTSPYLLGPYPGPSPLAAMTSEHNQSMIWGTYKAGLYFGVKSRSFPSAFVSGVMWGASDREEVLYAVRMGTGRVDMYSRFVVHKPQGFVAMYSENKLTFRVHSALAPMQVGLQMHI
eukprot:1320343-Amorphochlora_amoeboformis.AAC.1